MSTDSSTCSAPVTNRTHLPINCVWQDIRENLFEISLPTGATPRIASNIVVFNMFFKPENLFMTFCRTESLIMWWLCNKLFAFCYRDFFWFIYLLKMDYHPNRFCYGDRQGADRILFAYSLVLSMVARGDFQSVKSECIQSAYIQFAL